jgi:hypothetical protein
VTKNSQTMTRVELMFRDLCSPLLPKVVVIIPQRYACRTGWLFFNNIEREIFVCLWHGYPMLI